MSEEVKDNAESTEGEAPAAPSKPKKINRLSSEEIMKKISALDENGQSQSKYYKHLAQRKAELEKA